MILYLQKNIVLFRRKFCKTEAPHILPKQVSMQKLIAPEGEDQNLWSTQKFWHYSFLNSTFPKK